MPPAPNPASEPTPSVRPRIPESRTGRSRPPGPRGHWLVGCLPELLRDILGFVTECARQYGDCVEVPVGRRRVLLVSHPEIVEELLVRNDDCFIKDFAFRTTKPVLGNGLLLASGDFWKRQRHLVQPAFHRDRILPQAGLMVQCAERMLAGWENGGIVDLHRSMTQLTLEIIARILFGTNVSEEDTSVIGASLRTVHECIRIRNSRLVPIPDSVPTPVNLRMLRAARRIEQVVYRLISERRGRPDHPPDLLTSLLNARDASGAPMHDRQLRDEIMNVLMAGHETSTSTLVWLFLLLAQHPDEERKLHEELDSVLGDRPPTAHDLPRLKLTDWMVSESWRLFPPIWMIGREAVRPCTLAGFPVPAGTNVFLSQWVLHRDPRYFVDPEMFRPARWGDGSAAALPPFVYLPFGAGPRACVGAPVARIEMVLLVATIARRFTVRLTDQTELRPLASVTLRPAGPVMVRVLPRNRRDNPPHL